jgi:hypothetical protein
VGKTITIVVGYSPAGGWISMPAPRRTVSAGTFQAERHCNAR